MKRFYFSDFDNPNNILVINLIWLDIVNQVCKLPGIRKISIIKKEFNIGLTWIFINDQFYLY